jgi:uncharacterized protein involved in type VI secretion and phage assembly
MSEAAVLSDRAIIQMVVGGLSDASLVPVLLEAREAISTPFKIKLEFVSEVPRLAADAFLCRAALVTLQRKPACAGTRHRRCRGVGAAAHRGGGSLRRTVRRPALERGLRSPAARSR